MSLIPFLLDLADELQEYQRCLIGGVGVGVGMDIDDVDFGLQSLHEAGTLDNTTQQQQQQQQQHSPQRQLQQSPQQQQHQSRPRLLSQLYWPSSSIMHKHHQQHHHQRHHPYAQTARLCCSMKERDTVGGSSISKANSIAGLANKPSAYPVINKNGWMMVSMNVKQFTPDELIVKTIDNCIIVEGRHEDKEDIHGVISRHFIRKYMLPKGYDPNEVVSTLSSDGILTVKAPPPAPPKTKDEESTERIVDIQQQTGPAQTAVKQQQQQLQQQQQQQTTPTSPSSPSPTPPATAEAGLQKTDTTTTKTTTLTAADDELNMVIEGGDGDGGGSGEAPLEQPTQLDIEDTMQTDERSIEMETFPLEAEESSSGDAKIAKDDDDAEKCVVDDVVISNEDASGSGIDVVEKLEPAIDEMAASEILAESAKPEMQVDIVAESLVVNSNAAAIVDVPMTAAAAAEILVDVGNGGGGSDGSGDSGGSSASGTGDDGVDGKASDCNTNNIQLSTNNKQNEKNGIDAGVIVEAAIPVIKTAAVVLPAEVAVSRDLVVCVPKSVVIDAATAAAAIKENATDNADTVDEKNNGVAVVVDANGTNGDDVVENNGVVGAVATAAATAIESLPTAAEELVAN